MYSLIDLENLRTAISLVCVKTLEADCQWLKILGKGKALHRFLPLVAVFAQMWLTFVQVKGVNNLFLAHLMSIPDLIRMV